MTAAAPPPALELAQTRVEIEVKILLPLLRRLQFVGQRFDLSAQAGDFLGLALQLAGQVELGAALLVEARLRLVAEILDLAARLVVVEQARVRLADAERGEQQGDA